MHHTMTVNRQDLAQVRWLEAPLPELADGQALLRIDKFSFTANNITYAVIGDKFGYWQFFPTEPGWGTVPAWGYAEVAASRSPELPVGGRFYGYYPMSTHLVVQPARVGPAGFHDATPHRQPLPAIYNFYQSTEADPTYAPEREDLACLFRPLFITSFLLDDLLASEQFFGARQVVLVGASSKTALALAYLLYLRQRARGDEYLRTVGLTSARSLGFVDGLGLYDQALTYDQVATLSTDGGHVVVDFAGNQPVQAALQRHLGSSLRHNLAVGLAHWDQQGPVGPVEGGTKPTLFFAPNHAQKRQQDWGQAGFQAKLARAWYDFATHAGQWLAVETAANPAAVEAVYLATLHGQVPPSQGQMVQWPSP
jgi:hypothetical protein